MVLQVVRERMNTMSLPKVCSSGCCSPLIQISACGTLLHPSHEAGQGKYTHAGLLDCLLSTVVLVPTQMCNNSLSKLCTYMVS